VTALAFGLDVVQQHGLEDGAHAHVRARRGVLQLLQQVQLALVQLLRLQLLWNRSRTRERGLHHGPQKQHQETF